MKAFCETCQYRDKAGYCLNEKLAEDAGQDSNAIKDMLLYDYFEGGGFWVGGSFGCIHHLEKQT